MKKRFFSFLITIVLSFGAFAACAPDSSDSVDSSNTDSQTEEKVDIVSPDDGYDYTKELGKIADYEVIVPNNATDAEKYASDTFISYVKDITGVTLAYGNEQDNLTNKKAIVIGDTRYWDSMDFSYTEETLNGDGFVIRTVGDDIFVRGAIDRGTIYGVLDLVEYMLGVKFLAEDYTYIPNNADAKSYFVDKVSIPAFRYRAYLDDAVFANKNKDYIISRRYTSDYVTLTEGQGGNIKMFRNFKYNNTHNSLEYINLEEVSQNNVIKEEYVHAFSNDGVEVIKGGTGVLGLYANDLCYTDGINEDGTYNATVTIDGVTTKTAIQLAIEGMQDKILNDGNECNYYLFGQNDLSSRPCLCQDCKTASEKYTDAGIMIRFFNCLNRAIQAWKIEQGIERDISIVMFAYEYSAFAPVKENDDGSFSPIDETVKVDKEIVVRIAPVKAEFTYAYSDKKQDQNDYGSDYLARWQSMAEHFMVWSYHSNFQYYYAYLPTMHTWNKNFHDLQEMGVIYNFMQPNYQERITYQARMESYVASKMLWNPDYDYNELVKEFNFYYYGEAAYEYVNEYNDMIVNAYMRAMENESFTTKTHNYLTDLSVFTKGVLRRGVELFDEAIAAVEQDVNITAEEKERYIYRLGEAQLSPRYMYLLNASNLGYTTTEVNIMAQEYIVDVLAYGGSYFGESDQRKFDLEEIIYRPQ